MPVERWRVLLAELQRLSSVPGICLSVACAGRRADLCSGYRDCAGLSPLTACSQFELGCAAKLLLGIAAMVLAARGDLSLGAPIGAYLDELADSPHGRAVRVADLLAHTSGYRGTNALRGPARRFDWPSFVAFMRATPRLFAPGTVFSYEHSETVLLAEILRRLSGRDSEGLIDEMVSAPLGIASGDGEPAGRHRFEPQARRFLPASDARRPTAFWRAAFSSLSFSTAQLADIAAHLIGAASARPLWPGALGRMCETMVALPAMLGAAGAPRLPAAFGRGVARMHVGFLGASGVAAGQCLGLRFVPVTQNIVVVGINAFAPLLRDHVLDLVCADLGAGAPRPRPASHDCELGALEGDYLGAGDARVEARLRAGALALDCFSPAMPGLLHAELCIDRGSRPRLCAAPPGLLLGFFRAPADGQALMLGLGAFRRCVL